MSDRRGPNKIRYAAALAAAGQTYAEIIRDSGLSRQYLRDALSGARPLTARVEAALRDAVGPDGWRYALGETDVLIPLAP